MLMFLAGFLCCWLIIGGVCCIGDSIDRGVYFIDDAFSVFICLPLLIIALPFYIFYCFVIRPWRNVWTPVTQERFDEVMGKGHSRSWKIFPKIYLCFEAKARLINKIFFVRIKKER